jgi:hypothetical protein
MRPRLVLTIPAVVLALGVVAPSALALYPQLSAKLTGAAIGGVTQDGDANVDQSKYPSVPPRLEVRVKNVNLPSGTTLFVGVGCAYHNCLDYRKAGTFTLTCPAPGPNLRVHREGEGCCCWVVRP